MNDCGNAEVRDQLPDLLHDRLDEAARALVIAHVSTCIDCDEELALLRNVLGMMESSTPRIDVATILSALPRPPIASTRFAADAKVIPIATRQRRWGGWRVAAAATLIIAGGSSAVLLNRNMQHTDVVAVAPAANHAAGAAGAVGESPNVASASSSAAPTTGAVAVRGSSASTPGTMAVAEDPADAADLGNGSRLGDLNEQQLQTLLNEIDKLPAVPITDPDPVSLRVNARLTSSEGL